jgi:hypothetical protein
LIRVALFSKDSSRRLGQIEFKTLLVKTADDYAIEPAGLAAPEQIEEICSKLRRLPQVNWGIVDNLEWRVE